MMRKYYQKTEKDCQRCTIATLLQIDYDQVPAFDELIPVMGEQTREQGDAFEKAIHDFLTSKECSYFCFDATYKDCKVIFPQTNFDDCLCMAILKKKDRKYSHSVILNVNLSEGQAYIWHDPKRNSDYTIEDLTHIEIVVPGIVFKEFKECTPSTK